MATIRELIDHLNLWEDKETEVVIGVLEEGEPSKYSIGLGGHPQSADCTLWREELVQS